MPQSTRLSLSLSRVLTEISLPLLSPSLFLSQGVKALITPEGWAMEKEEEDEEEEEEEEEEEAVELPGPCGVSDGLPWELASILGAAPAPSSSVRQHCGEDMMGGKCVTCGHGHSAEECVTQ